MPLVLTRRDNERLLLTCTCGELCWITVRDHSKGSVRLGFDGDAMTVRREEVEDDIRANGFRPKSQTKGGE